MSFLIAGHTKFDVDHLFSVTATSYNSADAFNSQELTQIMCQSRNITAVLENGRFIQNWKEKVTIVNYQESGIFMN